MHQKDHFYVTTPIYYVTAKPHLGSLYSTIIADVAARWAQLNGKKTYFVTGTDEHGQKVMHAAQEAGKKPKEFVDQFIPAYQDVWNKYQIGYNHFVRTTDPDHIKAAQTFIKAMTASGDIYKDAYEGWYCTPCETFVTEKEIAPDRAPMCPSCNRQTIKVAEETYFFRLSAYQDKLLELYKNNPTFVVPKERINEVTSFVKEGLKDVSISRTTVAWGVPFPDEDKHTIYVWVEALCNYLSAIGYGNPAQQQLFNEWWPASLQVLGKDIVRFHAIFWPAFLMSAGLKVPRQLLVHGWIQVDKQKMSKSLGNVVDPMRLYHIYGPDPVRYYLMRQIPINQDGDFSIADLEQRISSDLANDLGNLLQRMSVLATKNNLTTIPAQSHWSSQAIALRDEGWTTVEDVHTYMTDYQFHLALARVWKFINKANAYFHEQEPWKVAKVDPQKFQEVIAATAHSLRMIGVLLWPYMPHKMSELLARLGHVFEPHNNTVEQLELGSWHQQFTVTVGEPLFVKPEESKESKPVSEKPVELAEKDTSITINDFAKVELRVGTIIACQAVEKSDKLLQMRVDFGDLGIRQILSGIKKQFEPEDLLNRQGIFVTNLKPRKMMGLESHGMLLLASDEVGKLHLSTVVGTVANGIRLS